MKQQALIFFTSLYIIFFQIKTNAQDISVDLKKNEKNYDNAFNKDFKIIFTNATGVKKKKIQIKTEDDVTNVIAESADLANFQIPIMVKEGKVSTKAKDDKEIMINNNLFQILIGDDKNFTVGKPLTVDLSNPKPNYEVSYKKGFKMVFNTKDNKPKSVTIIKSDKTKVVIDKKADLTKRKIEFTSTANNLTVKNESGKVVVISPSPFAISIDDKTVFTVSDIPAPTTTAGKPEQKEEEKKDKIPYWSYLKDNDMDFSLESLMIIPANSANCCDNCADCDDDAFLGNNRIIYDGKSGLTYFLKPGQDENADLCGMSNKTKYNIYKVDHSKKIKLYAGDPLVYIVNNVNPALYNLELSDSAFLTNNETNGLLESLLLSRSTNAVAVSGDGTKIQGGKEDEVKKENEDEYLKVKTGLLLVKSEMERLLENLRRSSPYLHNCLQFKKRQALALIDAFPAKLKRYKTTDNYSKYKFLQLVDVFLNQQTEDSTLNHQLKVLYGEFVAASYKIAYRYPQVPEQDHLLFRMSITAKPNSPYPSLLNVKMPHPTQTVYIKGFFKVDVSSGIYLGFRKDRTYALQSDTLFVRNAAGTADSSTNIKRIVKEDIGNQELGFASFLHLYYKTGNWFNVAGTIGAGFSFDKTIRPRYFTGISILLGSSNRLCINGGLVWGNYQELSNTYHKDGDNYRVLKDTENSLNYTTRFKNTGFLSISYNLPFLVRNSSTDAHPKDDEGSGNSTP